MRLPRLLALPLLLTALSLAPHAAADGSDLAAAAPPASSDAPASHFSCSPCRVGLQVGHWYSDQLPDELAVLRPATGGDYEQWREIDVNVPVAEAAADDLRQAGVTVDLLPATVPPGYSADAFVAVHADRDLELRWRGYKIAPSAFKGASPAGRTLSADVGDQYGLETGLPVDRHDGAITPDMRFYYAFNFSYFAHAIAPTTPAALIELGFDTNPDDRDLLYNHPDQLAAAVAHGIERFLSEPASA
jgi:hypothetical protein